MHNLIAKYNLIDQPAKHDQALVTKRAVQGDGVGKFASLLTGDEIHYCQLMTDSGFPTLTFSIQDSVIDFMSLLVKHTQNVNQCVSIYRDSDLASKYPLADNDLVKAVALATKRNDSAIVRQGRQEAEARKQSEANAAQIKESRINAAKQEGDFILPELDGDMQYPPGALGELAKHFFNSSVKPIQEFAICEAIAVAAGLFGRSHNVSGTGLNTYLMILAPSGTGKSALSKNPDNFLTYLERKCGVMGAKQFVMTQRFTHENAMLKEFKAHSSFCQCLSEFGKVLKNMVSCESGGGPLGTVKECMTDIYSKSGELDSAGGMRYASGEKTSDVNHAVAYSFLGESVAEPFFGSLTADMFNDGFISRFLFIEYNGNIPYDKFDTSSIPPAALTEHFKNAAARSIRALSDINRADVTHVGMDPWSGKWFNDFSRLCTDNANATRNNPVWSSLWSRCNLKVLKLAGLVAATDNPEKPMIKQQHVTWAWDFVNRHNHLIVDAMASGRMVNASHSDAMNALFTTMSGFIDQDRSKLSAYRVPNIEQMQDEGVIPWGYIQRRCNSISLFKGNKFKTPTAKIKEVMLDLVECGMVRRLPTEEVLNRFGTRGIVYTITQ